MPQSLSWCRLAVVEMELREEQSSCGQWVYNMYLVWWCAAMVRTTVGWKRLWVIGWVVVPGWCAAGPNCSGWQFLGGEKSSCLQAREMECLWVGTAEPPAPSTPDQPTAPQPHSSSYSFMLHQHRTPISLLTGDGQQQRILIPLHAN